MRTGRKTTDKKDYTIQLRVNDAQKDHVKRKAIASNISESEFIRKLIDKDRISSLKK